ncbi:MAG: ammonia-forming cytochrome c nitrite reductase subunit c552 [Armatimonadetes bacterium]|nr:ammonia-forming cytochrome c nitrite reductase subunit c552 [Armatimonadota bacterium]
MDEKRANRIGWFIFGGVALGVVALGLLASSILERREQRGAALIQMQQPIKEWEADNSKWGVNFPREYNSWESTKQIQENTAYGGSGHRDYLERDPRLVVMWAGYPFAKDYNAPRGHFHSLEDVNGTKRINDKTPGTCWTCKSPDVPRLMSQIGPGKFYAQHFKDLKHEITNTIGCADCHNPKTMALQISRPALIEAFRRHGKDVNKSTHQEMRTLVCAQCHVEYYFKDKKTNYLVFPWDEGLKAEDFQKYYQKVGFRDWVHAISGAKMIKMQHPDYEVYQQGIHAFRNVACADCHMPYKSEGGIKFTDHQVRSPLYNVANSCQVCHRWSEDEVRSRVTGIQDKNREMLDRAEDAITALHLEIRDAMNRGATDQELEPAREKVMWAQMSWDYVAANNGMGFHAPQECARVLGRSVDLAQQGRLMIAQVRARRGGLDFVKVPDISTKEKAQSYIKPFVDAQNAQQSSGGKKADASPAKAEAALKKITKR